MSLLTDATRDPFGQILLGTVVVAVIAALWIHRGLRGRTDAQTRASHLLSFALAVELTLLAVVWFVAPAISELLAHLPVQADDFRVYLDGPLAWFRYDTDPYDRLAMQRLNESVGLSAAPWSYANDWGYIGSPVNLWLFLPLHWLALPADTLVLWWSLGGLGVVAALSVGLAAASSRATTWLGRATAALITTSLVMGFHAETLRMAIIWGQLEPLYLGLTISALALILYKPESPGARTVAAVGLALATGIKLFPGVFAGYFLIKGLAEVQAQSGRWADRVKGSPSLRLSAATAAGIGVLALITPLLVDVRVIASWQAALDDRMNWMPSTQTTNSWMAAVQYFSHWANWVGVLLHSPNHLGAQLAAVTIAWLLRGGVALATWLAVRGAGRPSWLELALVYAALPTLLPHWYDYYNVGQLLFAVPIAFAALRVPHRGLRVLIVGLLAVAYLLTNLGFAEWAFGGDTGGGWAEPLAPVQQTLSPNLQPTAAHFIYGYPGLLMLWLATWLTLRQSPRRQSLTGPPVAFATSAG